MPTPIYNPPEFTVAKPRARSVISLTPLIDVVFILLIFFMLATSFMDWRAIALDTAKPPATVARSEPPEIWTLRIDEASIALNGEAMQLRDLLEKLQQLTVADPSLTLRIEPVGSTPLQPVVDLLDALSGAGFTRLNFVRDAEWAAEDAVERLER